MREQQSKEENSTDNYNSLEILNSKMEAQLLSSSHVQQIYNSSPVQDLLSNSPQIEQVLTSKILGLSDRNLPVFQFTTINRLKTQSHPKKIKLNNDKNVNQRILTYNRKAKSLQELSKKFIDHFEGKGNNIIELDKITKQLGVERRRIYDVINILQSLAVVTKKGKNNYQWKGLYQAVRTIRQCENQSTAFQIQTSKKEKSLQYLAGGFLKLFLNWKPAISLEEAAKQMMKQLDEASIKTKIRRLYDIINVFRSLGLVKKASLPSKKPGYQWAGTQILQQLIIKKQFNDENTGLSQLNQPDILRRTDEKQNNGENLNRSIISPMIVPIFEKLSIQNFKLSDETALQNDPFCFFRALHDQNSQKIVESNYFPTFRKSTSAFSLVAQQEKKQQ